MFESMSISCAIGFICCPYLTGKLEPSGEVAAILEAEAHREYYATWNGKAEGLNAIQEVIVEVISTAAANSIQLGVNTVVLGPECQVTPGYRERQVAHTEALYDSTWYAVTDTHFAPA